MKNVIFKLDNVIQDYPWGSKTALLELFGIANPNDQFQAEIWMGAHPNGCSKVANSGELLSDVINNDPSAVLGQYTHQRFGNLPYLFKVLSAQKPLSIQVHPRLSRAQEGFARENALGIPVTASNRNYRDANHKPELVYALTFYKAMNGFRPIEEVISLFKQANINTLTDELSELIKVPNADSLEAFFTAVMNLDGQRKQKALDELQISCQSRVKTALAREAFALSCEFRNEYADDIGLFAPLMLNVVELAPGEAMFLHAETPHAYIKGTGLEIMGNSDNVLRAGLTPKYIDVAELIANTRFDSIQPEDIKLAPVSMGNKLGYPIPVDDFAFEIITSNENKKQQFVRSAEILFCIEGEASISSNNETIVLKPGESLFVANNAISFEYQGDALLARAFN
ncbi:mannose-6-phosphate isomerase, class I [Psychromonas sp. KJ10-10]|uniref:mannose-6-phosphate isomerase, class I n=1 Tax=Psychromonas sp. KJ10-10 TaxID=3391823 RepID=UPI0039B5385F